MESKSILCSYETLNFKDAHKSGKPMEQVYQLRQGIPVLALFCKNILWWWNVNVAHTSGKLCKVKKENISWIFEGRIDG